MVQHSMRGLVGLSVEDGVWLLLYLSLVAFADLLYSRDHVSSSLDVAACERDVGRSLHEMALARTALLASAPLHNLCDDLTSECSKPIWKCKSTLNQGCS